MILKLKIHFQNWISAIFDELAQVGKTFGRAYNQDEWVAEGFVSAVKDLHPAVIKV